MANMEIKCNFASVFAKYDNVEDLKALANNICAQVKIAYEERFKEITTGKGVEVVVEVTDKKEIQAQPTNKAKKEKPAKSTETKPTKAKDKAEAESELISSSKETARIKKLGLTFEKYNDRCWVMRGDTKPLRKVLKEEFKGVFNSYLEGGEGWVIKNSNVEACAKALGLKVKIA